MALLLHDIIYERPLYLTIFCCMSSIKKIASSVTFSDNDVTVYYQTIYCMWHSVTVKENVSTMCYLKTSQFYLNVWNPWWFSHLPGCSLPVMLRDHFQTTFWLDQPFSASFCRHFKQILNVCGKKIVSQEWN